MHVDPSEHVEFSPISGAGTNLLHLHAYFAGYYIGSIMKQSSGGYSVCSNQFAPSIVPSEDEAREVMRMWVRRQAKPGGYRNHLAVTLPVT